MRAAVAALCCLPALGAVLSPPGPVVEWELELEERVRAERGPALGVAGELGLDELLVVVGEGERAEDARGPQVGVVADDLLDGRAGAMPCPEVVHGHARP